MAFGVSADLRGLESPRFRLPASVHPAPWHLVLDTWYFVFAWLFAFVLVLLFHSS
jgi:hypothetical protein